MILGEIGEADEPILREIKVMCCKALAGGYGNPPARAVTRESSAPCHSSRMPTRERR